MVTETREMDELLKKKVSRRSALKSFGAMGVAPLVFGPGLGEAKEEAIRSPSQELTRRASAGAPDLHRIVAGKMIIEFDKETGTVHSLSAKGDPLATNFLGNRLNVRGAKPLTPAATSGPVRPGLLFSVICLSGPSSYQIAFTRSERAALKPRASFVAQAFGWIG